MNASCVSGCETSESTKYKDDRASIGSLQADISCVDGADNHLTLSHAWYSALTNCLSMNKVGICFDSKVPKTLAGNTMDGRQWLFEPLQSRNSTVAVK